MTTKERTATPWGYSSVPDAERWERADSREDAVNQGMNEFGEDATFWITEGAYSSGASFLPSAQSIVDTMCDCAMDNGAPGDGEYPDVGAEGMAELEDAMRALAAWAEKWAQPRWWTAVGEPIEIKPELVAAFAKATADWEASPDSSTRGALNQADVDLHGLPNR